MWLASGDPERTVRLLALTYPDLATRPADEREAILGDVHAAAGGSVADALATRLNVVTLDLDAPDEDAPDLTFDGLEDREEGDSHKLGTFGEGLFVELGARLDVRMLAEIDLQLNRGMIFTQLFPAPFVAGMVVGAAKDVAGMAALAAHPGEAAAGMQQLGARLVYGTDAVAFAFGRDVAAQIAGPLIGLIGKDPVTVAYTAGTWAAPLLESLVLALIGAEVIGLAARTMTLAGGLIDEIPELTLLAKLLLTEAPEELGALEVLSAEVAAAVAEAGVGEDVAVALEAASLSDLESAQDYYLRAAATLAPEQADALWAEIVERFEGALLETFQIGGASHEFEIVARDGRLVLCLDDETLDDVVRFVRGRLKPGASAESRALVEELEQEAALVQMAIDGGAAEPDVEPLRDTLVKLAASGDVDALTELGDLPEIAGHERFGDVQHLDSMALDDAQADPDFQDHYRSDGHRLDADGGAPKIRLKDDQIAFAREGRPRPEAIPLPADADGAELLAALARDSKSWGPWAKAYATAGGEADLEAIAEKAVNRLPAERRTVQELRIAMKDATRESIVAAMFDVEAPEASVLRMRELTGELNSADAASLQERWRVQYGREFEDREIVAHPKMAQGSNASMAQDRVPDGVDVTNGVVDEVKGHKGPLDGRSVEQIDDFLAQANEEEGATLTKGGKEFAGVKKVRVTFTSAEGARANAGKIAKWAKKNPGASRPSCLMTAGRSSVAGDIEPANILAFLAARS